MRAKDLRVLFASAGKIAPELASSHIAALGVLARLFDEGDSTTVATRLSAVDRSRLSTVRGAPSISAAREAMSLLKARLPQARRRSVARDFTVLGRLMEGHGLDSVLSFVESVRSQFAEFASPTKGQRKRGTALNQEIVRSYLRRLEDALRDEKAFPALVHEMEHNPHIRQAELVAIAGEFYGPTPQSASKKDCVRRIMSRHRSLMDYRAKAKAQAGKSAA